MMPRALRFAGMNLLLVALCVAIAIGGDWPVIVFVATILLVTVGDETAGDDVTATPAAARFFDAMLYLTVPLMALALGLGLVSLAGALPATTPLGLVGMVLALGLFAGAAATNVAHELVHRTGDRRAWYTARALLAVTADTGFAIEHVYGHHRHVGTARDPATARRGETLYAFVARSTLGQITSAFAFERERLARHGVSPWSWHNRLLSGQILTIALFVAGWALAGLSGLALLAIVALQGKAYLEAVNYIEHYGLAREPGTRVETRHSWNSHRAISNALLYNLPRHAEHHIEAAKPFWQLEVREGAPVLPHGYKTMILLALVPPLFRAVVQPRLDVWDRELATTAERDIASAGLALPARAA